MQRDIKTKISRFLETNVDISQSTRDELASVQEEMDMEESMVMLPVLPGYEFHEFLPESEKGKSEDKEVHQLPNKLAIEIDGSDDNANYSIKHPAGSRLEFFHDGRGILKTWNSWQMSSLKNILLISRNTMEVAASRRININTMRFYLDAEEEIHINSTDIMIKAIDTNISSDLHIEGDTEIFGDVTIDGDVEITGEVNITGKLVVNGIDFSTHHHITPHGPTIGNPY
jgi:phage baseplate assembly protein gpV